MGYMAEIAILSCATANGKQSETIKKQRPNLVVGLGRSIFKG